MPYNLGLKTALGGFESLSRVGCTISCHVVWAVFILHSLPQHGCPNTYSKGGTIIFPVYPQGTLVSASPVSYSQLQALVKYGCWTRQTARSGRRL